MKKETVIYQSKYDGLMIHADHFQVDHPEALVVIFHGMAEHRHRYDYFAEKLNAANYNVLTIDHRGHNQSQKILGHFSDSDGWKKNIEDLHGVISMVKSELPIYLFGHSMGSMYARSYLKRYETEISKLILSGSPSYNKWGSVGIFLAKILIKIKGPTFISHKLDNSVVGNFNKQVKNPKTNVDWISKSQENVQEYLADDLCGFPFTVSGYLDLFLIMKDAYSHWQAKNPQLPIKFFSGAEDPCSCRDNGVVKAVSYLNNNGYQNVKYQLYPELRHEILNEAERDIIIKDMIDFLKNK